MCLSPSWVVREGSFYWYLCQWGLLVLSMQVSIKYGSCTLGSHSLLIWLLCLPYYSERLQINNHGFQEALRYVFIDSHNILEEFDHHLKWEWFHTNLSISATLQKSDLATLGLPSQMVLISCPWAIVFLHTGHVLCSLPQPLLLPVTPWPQEQEPVAFLFVLGFFGIEILFYAYLFNQEKKNMDRSRCPREFLKYTNLLYLSAHQDHDTSLLLNSFSSLKCVLSDPAGLNSPFSLTEMQSMYPSGVTALS